MTTRGRGPLPKPPERRARYDKRDNGIRVIVAEPAGQPDLPIEIQWPQRTVEWWAMWGASPLSSEFTTTDWSELMDTAVVHARHWTGDIRAAAELRQRVAKFGATPEDRARLRITFAQAEDAEKRVGKAKPRPARVLTAVS